MTTPTQYRPRALSMRVLGVLVTGYERLSGVSGFLRPEPRAVDRTRRVRVREVRVAAQDVVELTFEPLDERPLPRWHPGAHVDVEVPGIGLRQYSLCGDPQDRFAYTVAVRRITDGDGGSCAMHDLRVGDGVTLRGPRNAFPFVTAQRYLFVAGGIGITPIRAMVHDAHRRGADWQLVYCGRSRESMPFADELLALDPARVHLRPDDEYGVPDGREIVSLIEAGAALYTCGPPAMIETLKRALPAENIDSLHYERFSAPPVVGGEPFELVLARSGQIITVGAQESALTAIRRVLPDVAYSCRQGFCGTCPVALFGGEVEHRDRCLTPEQRQFRFAPCVSRGTDRLTLDL